MPFKILGDFVIYYSGWHKKKEEVKYIYEKQKTKTKTISDLEVVRSIPSVIECKAKKIWKIRRRIFDHYMSEKKME